MGDRFHPLMGRSSSTAVRTAAATASPERARASRFPGEGTVFTVDTSPNLELDGDFAWESGQPVGEQTFSYRGAIAWSAEDGRSGSCAFDLEVTRSEDGTLAESSTACGVSVDEL